VLRAGEHALTAENAAGDLQGVLAGLRAGAKVDADAHLARQMTTLPPEADPRLVKALNEERDTTEASYYAAARERLLSILHTWFAQEFMRASGVAVGQLPHPEFYVGAPPALLERPPAAAVARAALEQTEQFMRTIELNVSEDLAVLDYCQRLCAEA